MKEEELKKTWEKYYFSENCHEKEIIDDLPNLLKSCEVFFDIGASGGQYTFFANKILQNKNIIAVEADPIRFNILNKSCKEWESINNNNIQALHRAFYEKDDEFIDFYVTESNVSGSLFINDHIKAYMKEVDLTMESVATISLIKLLNQFPNQKIFAKIDVEGAEYSAFKGAYSELKKHDVTFLIEIHNWKDSNTELYPWNIFKYFNKAGFAPYSYKKHFIVKKTNNLFLRIWANFLYSIIYRFKFILQKLKN
ncbi:MAG TPA: FkbM family methyltransferase [Vicingus sp.]|nr:FkbM family methyltransferase [Vicingus sp.]HRP60368.1 FkbM family methyltransferase [Vicingus sp.]